MATYQFCSSQVIQPYHWQSLVDIQGEQTHAKPQQQRISQAYLHAQKNEGHHKEDRANVIDQTMQTRNAQCLVVIEQEEKHDGCQQHDNIMLLQQLFNPFLLI